ncbi:hypothetical protein DEO72_LG5g1661 [Vigna unguiculata]|uniref:Uncharacterized protein n=1 Tax=Vigna unguiculata TaxID=3917 RepID=A0A4D6M028_VIGUN|nr:hypothetical protein DEO72_LG5g1661 [Vigna unguiculata]
MCGASAKTTIAFSFQQFSVCSLCTRIQHQQFSVSSVSHSFHPSFSLITSTSFWN